MSGVAGPLGPLLRVPKQIFQLAAPEGASGIAARALKDTVLRLVNVAPFAESLIHQGAPPGARIDLRLRLLTQHLERHIALTAARCIRTRSPTRHVVGVTAIGALGALRHDSIVLHDQRAPS